MDIIASLVKAPVNSSIIIGNSAGTGGHVASNGAVGILKVPTEALDVQGNAQVSGNLVTQGNADVAGTLTVNNKNTYTQVLFTNTNSLFTNFDLQAQGCTLRAYPFSGWAPGSPWIPIPLASPWPSPIPRCSLSLSLRTLPGPPRGLHRQNRPGQAWTGLSRWKATGGRHFKDLS